VKEQQRTEKSWDHLSREWCQVGLK